MGFLKLHLAGAALCMAVCTSQAATPTSTAEPSPATATEAVAAAINLSPAEADSVSRAYATVMASYLAPYIKENFPDDPQATGKFLEGMRHAFTIRHEDDPYFAGVRSAMANFDRLDDMASMGFPITPDSYLEALGKALAGETYGMDRKSADAYLHEAMAKLYPAPEPLTPESQQAFLDAQKAREGVTTLPSGLLFEVITEGEGEAPRANDTARVLYTGALADGTVFDSTEKPIDLPVDGVVPGFSEGLMLMKPGGTYRLYIPASLGYGERGAGGGVIPPGAALDFKVTLLDIIPGAKGELPK